MAIFKQRRKRRRDTPPVGRTAVGGFLVILVLAGAGYLATRVYNGIPGADYGQVFVSVPRVGNLLPHDQVRIDGVRVGQVLKRNIGEDGRPRVELQLEPGTELPRGTKVVFRAAGLLGARFVELRPGSGREPLPDGATIEGETESYTFGVPEALTTFDEETRGGLGDSLGGLGQGLLGRGAGVNDTIRVAAEQAQPFSETARAILRRDGAAGRLVGALDAAVRPLDANRAELARLNGVAADAVTPFVTERDAVRATLAAAPPTLRALRPGLSKGTRLLAAVRDVADEATRTLPDAPEGLRGLSALLRDGRAPLSEADKLLRSARPAVPGALRITSALSPLLVPLKDTLAHAEPLLTAVGRYECDIRNFGVSMRSMTGFTQPGEGPGGPSAAFRLQFVAPLSTDLVGVKDTSGFNQRRGVVEPCTFLSGPYPVSGPPGPGGSGGPEAGR